MDQVSQQPAGAVPGPGSPTGSAASPEAPAFVPVRLTLPGGVTLEVRRLGPDDEAALAALYAGLGQDDRRLRFFAPFRPPASFVRRWLDPAGGLVLGAFVREGTPVGVGDDMPAELATGGGAAPAANGDLVAEAGYARLPNGNGELGMTTAPAWRGWLGPFLLDLLATAAHEAGVEAIEADIRVDNRSMLGLVAHRGSAVAAQPVDGVIRLVMGTAGDVPPWPSRRAPGRVRVLVESPDGRWSPPPDAALQGLEVLSCPGPHGRSRGRCPLLEGEHCPLVEGADEVVVVTGEGDDGSFPALAELHRRRGAPVGVHTCGTAAAVGELLSRLAAEAGTGATDDGP